MTREELRAIRKGKKLKQAQMAEQLGVSANTYMNYERGKVWTKDAKTGKGFHREAKIPKSVAALARLIEHDMLKWFEL